MYTLYRHEIYFTQHEHWTHKVRQALFTVKKTENVIAVPQNAKVKRWYVEDIKKDEVKKKRRESSPQKYNSANRTDINDYRDTVANDQKRKTGEKI